MQVDAQARDDFCWLDHATGSRDELTSLIKAHLPLFTKAAVAVSQIKFITQIAAHDGYAYLIFPCCIAATGIQHLDPRQHSAKLIIALFNTIASQGNMRYDATDTSVCKQDIGAIAHDEQRPVLLGTQAHQIKQFFFRCKRDPHIRGTTDTEGSMSCQWFMTLYPLLKVRVEFLVYCLGITCHRSILSVRRHRREFLAEHRTCRITHP